MPTLRAPPSTLSRGRLTQLRSPLVSQDASDISILRGKKNDIRVLLL